MAAPNIDTRFAGNATYGGTDPWSGDPTKVDPGTPRKAEGFVPDKLPAEWLNWLLNAIGAWIYWIAGRLGGLTGALGWAYETERSRVLVIPGAAVQPGLDGSWVGDEGGGKQCQVNAKFATFAFADYLPVNCQLTGITVYVATSSASAAGIRFRLFEDNVQFGSTFNSATSSGSHTAVSGALTKTIDRTGSTYYMEILSSSTAASAPPGDRIFKVVLGFKQFGPDTFEPSA